MSPTARAVPARPKAQEARVPVLDQLNKVVQAVAGIGSLSIALVGFIALTGARHWSLPDKVEANRVAIDSMKAEIEEHVRYADQENRAQTCMLLELARGADPSACTQFLPDPSYYKPTKAANRPQTRR